MQTFYECHCGYFHEDVLGVRCDNPETRVDLGQIPVDAEVLYLTKEQGGKFYLPEEEVQ
jgi:hypothetical protein